MGVYSLGIRTAYRANGPDRMAITAVSPASVLIVNWLPSMTNVAADSSALK